MTIANRLRGTYGAFAKEFGFALFVVLYTVTGDVAIALLIGGGYWLGELACGWGDHIGNLTGSRRKIFEKFPNDGSDIGVRWLTSVIVYPKLIKLHLSNAKKGIYNWYPKIVNLEVKGYSIAKLLKINVQPKPIDTFVIEKTLMYSRVYLVVRGFVWWLLPMIGIGMLTSATVAVVGLLVLSFGWVVCAELGYYFRDKIAIEKFGLSYVGGWELQEGFYGVLQDLVLVVLVCSKLL